MWIALAGAAAGFAALLGASAITGHAPQGRAIMGGQASSTIAANLPCVSAAVAAREASLGAGITTYTQNISAAYTARAGALASAFTQAGNDAIKNAEKTAWNTFNAAVKLARSNWKTAENGAWTQFKGAARACGSSATAVFDASHATSDATVAGGN